MATVSFKLNGKPVELEVDEARTLLWVLRTDLALTGVKYGCGEGLCGACTVLVNGEAVLSCQTSVQDIGGTEVVTIEGLAKDGNLASGPAGIYPSGCPAMRFFHAGHDFEGMQRFVRKPSAHAR